MLEQQLKVLVEHFESALAAKNWERLAQLDTRLQALLAAVNQQPLSVAAKARLQQLHSLYDTMIVAGEKEKLMVKQRLNQQTGNQEGMHAYLQVQK